MSGEPSDSPSCSGTNGIPRIPAAGSLYDDDAIISFTLAGDILSWNQGAERIFGYGAREIAGQPHLLLAPSGQQEEMKWALEKLRRGESIPTFEKVHVRKDGIPIDVSISMSAMRGEAGELVGATAIAQDITTRKEAAEELRQTRNQLEERVEHRTIELRERADQLRRLASELTRSEQSERTRMAGVLHDHVQQLLVSAKMRLEALRKKVPSEQKDEVSTVLRLLEESLDSSRSLAVELSPPVLNEGLAPAVEWLGSVWMSEKHGLNVTLDLDRRIDAASQEMRNLVFLAVRELLFNVVKHAGVTTASVELAAKDAATLRVTVKDAGKGFDPANLTLKSSGCGLGLLTVRERINMLGGSLELRSKPGAGAEAVILAPRGKDVVRKMKDNLEA